MNPESSYCATAFLNPSMFISLWPPFLPKDVRFVKLKTWLGFGVLKWQDLQKKRKKFILFLHSIQYTGCLKPYWSLEVLQKLRVTSTTLKVLTKTKPRHFQLKLSFTAIWEIQGRKSFSIYQSLLPPDARARGHEKFGELLVAADCNVGMIS